MPLLLEDLADEASASNLRTADRLEAEAQELFQLRQVLSVRADLARRMLESARQATELVLARSPQTEGVWRLAVAALRTLSREEGIRLLGHLVSTLESGLRLARVPRRLWKLAEQLEITPERLDELEKAEGRYEQLTGEARAALEHRTRGWQPDDPERLAHGLQLALEGKTVKAEEALARFGRPRNGEGGGVVRVAYVEHTTQSRSG